MGGRGASSGKAKVGMRGGGGNFSPIDTENTNLSKKQLTALSLQRWEAWSAARQALKSIPETKEPKMTKRMEIIAHLIKRTRKPFRSYSKKLIMNYMIQRKELRKVIILYHQTFPQLRVAKE